MISVEDAIGSAKEFLIKINEKQISNLNVEEVELAGAHSIIITLGWDEINPLDPIMSMAEGLFTTPPTKRVYKLFYVDVETGNVEKMKIRNVNND